MTPTRSMIGLVLGAALAAAGLPPPAAADTATNLTCKGCVGKRQLGTKAVVTKKIRDGAVTAPKIADGAVTSAKIGGNAVTSAKILDGTILPADLAAAAKPAGVDSVESTNSYPLATAPESILSTTVTVPTAGHVVVIATWYFFIPTSGHDARCHLTTAAGVSGGPSAYTVATSNNHHDDAALTRVFDVPAGNRTFHLNCEAFTVAGVVNPSITAMFFPTRY